MAVTGDQNVRNCLKVFYAKNGLENLLFRNDPFLPLVKGLRVEGKAQAFAAMDGQTPAVGGDFLEVDAMAIKNPSTKEFYIEPSQLFTAYTLNAKEIKASATLQGAYLPIAVEKMFSSTEALRKTMAACAYGSGYGEISKVKAAVALVANTEVDVEMSDSALVKITSESKLDIKPSIESSTINATVQVKAIKGNKVTVVSDTTYTTAESDVFCLAGSMNSSGEPLLPVGWGGWAPFWGGRTGTTWETNIAKDFFRVNRSQFPERLACNFYMPSDNNEAKATTIQKALRINRRAGSVSDLILLNDEDYLELMLELQAKGTDFTSTADKSGKKYAKIGIADATAMLSTSITEKILDTPYLEKGTFLIVELDTVRNFYMTDVDAKVKDGYNETNAAGVDNPIENVSTPDVNNYGLIIDDILAVVPGVKTTDGPATEVVLQYFGQFVVTNPAHQLRGIFARASGDYSDLLGW